MKANNLTGQCALLLSLALPVWGHAQTSTDTTAIQPSVLTAGEIKRVDLDGGKVTIKHGEIKNLDMPPMTMVFVAKDRSQLSTLKVGQRVHFVASNEAGKFIASDMQLAE